MARKPRATLTARQQALAPQKVEFLKILRRIGNISEAARRAGVKRSQGESWARAAGIENVPLMDGKREEFARLRATGATRKEAAARPGRAPENRLPVGPRRGRPADGLPAPDVAYKSQVTTAFAEHPGPLSLAGGFVEGPALPPAPDRVR